MNNLIGTFSSASILIPVLFGFYAVLNQPGPNRALFSFFLYGLITEVIALVLVYHGDSNNLWVYNIYKLAECIFWIVIFGNWLKGRFVLLSYLLAIIYSAIWIYTTLIVQSIFDFNSVFRVAESIILMVISAFFLLEISRKGTASIVQTSEFWFAAAVLFYFSSTSLISASALYLFEGKLAMRVTWHMHSLFNIIANLIFAKAFLCISRKTT